jgi:hypothetical protein
MEQILETTNRGAKVTFGIHRGPLAVLDLPVGHQDFFTIDLSHIQQIGPAEVAKARVDFEIMARMLREHPKEMADIVNETLASPASRSTAPSASDALHLSGKCTSE